MYYTKDFTHPRNTCMANYTSRKYPTQVKNKHDLINMKHDPELSMLPAQTCIPENPAKKKTVIIKPSLKIKEKPLAITAYIPGRIANYHVTRVIFPILKHNEHRWVDINNIVNSNSCKVSGGGDQLPQIN